MKKTLRRTLVVFLAAILAGCISDNPVPKPVGYFRIDTPEHSYTAKDPNCPFSLEVSEYSYLEYFENTPCWFNIVYPDLKAKVHLTYKPINSNLRELIEESRNFAYEHQVKASGISPAAVTNNESTAFGLTYELKGNVASPYQFYLTDSTNHFLRGSLYFESRPNSDSLSPSLNYIKEDMEYLISTFNWKSE